MINNENNLSRWNIYAKAFSKEDLAYLNKFYNFLHKLLIMESVTFTLGLILFIGLFVTLVTGHVFEIKGVKYISFNWTFVYVFCALFLISLLIQWGFNVVATKYVIFIIRKLKTQKDLTWFEIYYWKFSLFYIWLADLISIIMIVYWVWARVRKYVQIIQENEIDSNNK